MKALRAACILLVVITVAGCQYTLETLTGQEKAYPRSNPNSITLTSEAKLAEPFTEIGQVLAVGSTSDEAVTRLKNQAATYGGNAIIRLQTKVTRRYIFLLFIPIPMDSYCVTGTIVVKTNKEGLANEKTY